MIDWTDDELKQRIRDHTTESPTYTVLLAELNRRAQEHAAAMSDLTAQATLEATQQLARLTAWLVVATLVLGFASFLLVIVTAISINK